MPHIQSSLQIQIENWVVPTDDVEETTEVTRDPRAFPQWHRQSNAMSYLPHSNLVSRQTVNQTESSLVSMKLSPFNYYFSIQVQLRKYFMLEKWRYIYIHIGITVHIREHNKEARFFYMCVYLEVI